MFFHCHWLPMKTSYCKHATFSPWRQSFIKKSKTICCMLAESNWVWSGNGELHSQSHELMTVGATLLHIGDWRPHHVRERELDLVLWLFALGININTKPTPSRVPKRAKGKRHAYILQYTRRHRKCHLSVNCLPFISHTKSPFSYILFSQ